MHKTRAVIGIINYNTRDELRACLESLRDCLDRVVVFDNHSNDGSSEMVRRDYPEAALIESHQNLGYGAAANRVFLSHPRAQGAEILILSNSDVVFFPESIAVLLDDLLRHPEAGITGLRLLNTDGTLQRSCFPLPGSWRWLVDNDSACAVLGLLPGLKQHLLRLWPHDREREVPWVKGAMLAMRRSAFEEAGAFDESFFMYYEETDLCYRMAKKGWRVRFTPASEVTHLGGASTTMVRTDMAVEQFISFMRFARRHYSPPHATLLLCLWKAVLLARFVRDRLTLAFRSGMEDRPGTRDDLSAWRRSLAWTFRDLDVPAGNDRRET